MSRRLRNLKVEIVFISNLKPNPLNTRIHSKKQIQQIANSIGKFGWTNPILIDAEGRIIAGHGRIEAAKLLGRESVPVIRVEGMTEAQRRAYSIADNKLTENAGWNRELLALEFKALFNLELDFDVTITGFDMGEIDVLIRDIGKEAQDAADSIPEINPAAPVITQPGHLWKLGPHRLLCADATKTESFERLMDGALAEAAFADPPYNVPIAGHVSGLGAVRHAEFAMATGEMSEAEYIGFLTMVLGSIATHSVDGAINFICVDWRHLLELLLAGRGVYSELKNICVWVKTNSGMGSLYRSQHEFVAVFKRGTSPHINNVELGRYGRNRTNIWTYAGMNSFGVGRDETLAMHPTVKPVAMVEDAILDCSNRNGIILDPFVGSGTTLIAAERTGRHGFGLEIDPKYVDVALRRFRSLTGVEPMHAESGRTLKDLEQESESRSSRASAVPKTDQGDRGKCGSRGNPPTAAAVTTRSDTASRHHICASSPGNPEIPRAGRRARTTSKPTSKPR